MPKTKFYQENGKGRDTYILNDNGGFNRYQIKKHYKMEISRMNNANKIDYIHRNTLATPMIHHFSDGTGRD